MMHFCPLPSLPSPSWSIFPEDFTKLLIMKILPYVLQTSYAGCFAEARKQ